MFYLAITSAMDPRLNMFDESILVIKYLEDSDLFHQRKRLTEGATDLKRPKYSLSLAYTLSIASKLVYEDVEVIKYELKKAGFDIDRTFRPIAYKVGNRGVFFFKSVIYADCIEYLCIYSRKR